MNPLAALRIAWARLAHGNALMADPHYAALHRQEAAARARKRRSSHLRAAKADHLHNMLRTTTQRQGSN